MTEIQRFVTTVIESVGGIVEPLEYALVDVMLPERFREIFQDRTELKLAFDFEVAQENPQSEFVTFGSDVFNNVLDIANTSALSTIRYGIIDNLSCFNAETKILGSLHPDQHNVRITILDQKPILVPIILFNFRALYSSDIQVSEDVEVWINLYNNAIVQDLKSKKEPIFFEKSPVYDYPLGKKYSISAAFELAFQKADTDAKQESKKHQRNDELESELSRIKTYYHALSLENEKRLHRKGLSEEKKVEIQSKSETLKLECEKQLSEITNKHLVKTSIRLMNSIMYYVPFLAYRYELSDRKGSKQYAAIYNPIQKSFEV